MNKILRKFFKYVLFKNKSFIIFINYHNLNTPELNVKFTKYLKLFEFEIKLYNLFFKFEDVEKSICDIQTKNTIEPTAVITFDDGYYSQYKATIEVLNKFNIKPIHFISSQNLGDKYYWNDIASSHFLNNSNSAFNINDIKYKILSERNVILNSFNKNAVLIKDFYKLSNEEQVKHLNDSKAIIGGHTKDHPILSLEDDDICVSQIVDDKVILEQLLMTPIKYFAYPNGKYQDFGIREKVICTVNGYKYLFTSEPGLFWPATDCSAIPRLSLQIGTPFRNLNYIIKMVRENI